MKDMKKKEFKCISHVERMNNKDVQREYNIDGVTYAERTQDVVSYEVYNGVPIKVLKSVLVSPAKEVEGFKYTDFCMENLIATGAVANLKSVTLNGNLMTDADNIGFALDAIGSIDIPEE